MKVLWRRGWCSPAVRLVKLEAQAGYGSTCVISCAWTLSRKLRVSCVRCSIPVKGCIVSQAAAPSSGASCLTLAGRVKHELEVKHSKFVALAAPVDTEAQALAFLSEVRDTRATHNCWAFKIGERIRFSDDGEPGGTAGRPILSAIVASGLDRTVVVVIRFFGGIKLGTGGLVRAYGGVTADCLKDAPTIEHRTKVLVTLVAPYDLLGVVYSLLHTHGAEKVGEEYSNSGSEDAAGVSLKLWVDEDRLPKLEEEVRNSCRGRASLTTSSE